MKKKKFDCVEMKYKAQKEIQKKLKGLGPEKQFKFWQKRHNELLKEFGISSKTAR